MAPGLCSGTNPKITWMWKGRRKEDSYIADNITDVTTETGIGVTRKHVSTLTFEAAASQHFTNVTCKVSFKNNISTEETVTLNVNCEYIPVSETISNNLFLCILSMRLTMQLSLSISISCSDCFLFFFVKFLQRS